MSHGQSDETISEPDLLDIGDRNLDAIDNQLAAPDDGAIEGVSRAAGELQLVSRPHRVGTSL